MCPIREVSSLQRVLRTYVQASMKLGPEDVSSLERCRHFRGCYIQVSMVLLERCPHFRGCYVRTYIHAGFNGVTT